MRKTSFANALSLAALLGLGGACGGSGSGGGVDLQQAFALSEGDADRLVQNVWERETDTWYTSYLTINPDCTSGFLCHTDGKSESTDVRFIQVDGRTAMTGKSGFGEGPDFVEYIETFAFDGDTLVITGEEKDLAYSQTFRPVAELPEYCQKIRNGEDPDGPGR
jgi:hypothetical protein